MFRTVAQYAQYLLVLAVVIAAGFAFNALSIERSIADQRLAMTQASAEVASGLERVITERILISEGIAAVFEADPNLPFEQFTRVVRQLVGDANDVINVAVAPDLVIEYVYPLDGNENAVGLDLNARPDLMVAISESLRTGTTILDGPFDLVQGGSGFITRAPVFEVGSDFAAGRPWGVASVVIDQERLFLSTGLFDEGDGLAVSVMNMDGDVVFGEAGVAALDPIMSPLRAPGINWAILVAPQAGWVTVAPDRTRIWSLVAIVGLMSMVVMRAFEWVLARSARAETTLAEAIEALEDGFAIYDETDHLIMCNERYKAIYAASADAMVPGTSFEAIIRRGLETGQYMAALGREDEWLQERLSAHRNPGEPLEQRLEDGRWLRVVERRTPSGNTVGFRVDVTAFKEALARAESASAAKTDFLNTVSHELRTPLTVVLGYNAFIGRPEKLPSFAALNAAIEGAEPAEIRKSLDAYQADLTRFSKQIDISGQQLMGLLTGILDLAAIEEGTLTLKREPLSLQPVCQSVVEQFQPLAEKKGLAMVLSGEAPPVFADPLRIKQILFNLVSNAVKFTETGTITIRIGVTGQQVWVEVEDTGRGLGEADQDRIFDRFGQLDGSSTREHGGVGLGLPISRHLAELHGGAVTVRSELGKGSIFRLELAAADTTSDAAA